MRHVLFVITLAGVAACQPAQAPAPPAETMTASDPVAAESAPVVFTMTDGAGTVRLAIDEGSPDLLFTLDCLAEGPVLTATGATSQVALGNMASPYAISLSGASFEATLVSEDDLGPTFSVTAPLGPDILSALGGATTARIMVNDNYAYVESGVDTTDNFETFAAACAALTGISPAP